MTALATPSLRIRTLKDYLTTYEHSVEKPEQFWSSIAESFRWQKPWNEVVRHDFTAPSVEWFSGAKVNITENIFERNLNTLGEQTAIIWEPNDPSEKAKKITYKELWEDVCRFSNALTAQGVVKGDRVVLYMSMVPEAAIAMLACARIGAVHSVVFGGFSAQSLADRINDCEAKIVLTVNESLRGAKSIALKEIVDEALTQCTTVEKVLVVKRTHRVTPMETERDIWWHDAIADCSTKHTAPGLDAEDMLFILYTSGSTGKPKGVVHTQAGYMVYTAYSFENVFQCSPGDVYFCTADVGWITGHSYLVYGPLLSGATVVMYEGIPTYPDASRFWQIIDKHSVSHFYTAPTAIRALQAEGASFFESASLKSLKVLGTVGEPINEDAWQWYYHNIGKERCPIVDTWWQTETGGIMLSPLAGITPTKPCHATLPLPGIQPILVDDEGKELIGNAVEGNLCIRYPWPSMLRTTYGDHERCRSTYFSRFKGLYFTGDGARRDTEGYYRLLGRVDDVMNVSGHRIGTAEVENAINEHPHVMESAVVGCPHPIKGQGIAAFAIVEEHALSDKALADEIRGIVRQQIGAIASPDALYIVPGLPKTRSGKIMRRLLRNVAAGETESFGDVSTLLNPEVVTAIAACTPL
jgi:acetyl-CoA synthetase